MALRLRLCGRYGGDHGLHLGTHLYGRSPAQPREPRHPPRRVRKSAATVVFLLRLPASRLVDGAYDVRLRTPVQHLGVGVSGSRLGRDDDDRYRLRHAGVTCPAWPCGAGHHPGPGLAVGGVPEAHPEERPRRSLDKLADHGQLQRSDHGCDHEQKLSPRTRKPGGLPGADDAHVRHFCHQPDPGSPLPAHRANARESGHGPDACPGWQRRSGRCDLGRHAGCVFGVRAALLRTHRGTRAPVCRNADGPGGGRTHHRTD